MSDLEQLAQGILAAQPFSRLLGAELTAFEPGRAELVLPLNEQLLQQNGFAHGGVIAYLADNALTFAGGTALGVNVITSEFKINFIRPAAGARLRAEGTVVHAGRRQAVCRCEIFVTRDGEEKLCAVAQGTIVRVGN